MAEGEASGVGAGTGPRLVRIACFRTIATGMFKNNRTLRSQKRHWIDGTSSTRGDDLDGEAEVHVITDLDVYAAT